MYRRWLTDYIALDLMSVGSPIRALYAPWEPYDPSWLVRLAREQPPGEAWLAEAFSRCTRARGAGSAYVEFVSRSRPNQRGSEWQAEKNLVLDHPIEGEVVVDVLQGGRIGGVELWKKLL